MLENYYVDDIGVIRQQTYTQYNYDANYIKSSYGVYGDELNLRMAHLRLGYIIGSIGHIPTSILDVGYGAGHFLSTANNIIDNCYGFDVIKDLDVPKCFTFVDRWLELKVDVLTMFDVLEHFEDPYIIKNANANYISVSMPECHYFDDDWFFNWKHRKPNEHLNHFNKTSLGNFMRECGYSTINITNIEDTIRNNHQPYSNIVSGVFKKIDI